MGQNYVMLIDWNKEHFFSNFGDQEDMITCLFLVFNGIFKMFEN